MKSYNLLQIENIEYGIHTVPSPDVECGISFLFSIDEFNFNRLTLYVYGKPEVFKRNYEVEH